MLLPHAIGRIRNGLALAILTLSLSLLGCGGLSRTNYDQVKFGMTLSEVESILGKGSPSTIHASMAKVEILKRPDAAEPAVSAPPPGGSTSIWMQWGSGNQYILVFFMNGKAIMKQQEGL